MGLNGCFYSTLKSDHLFPPFVSHLLANHSLKQGTHDINLQQFCPKIVAAV